MRSKGPESNGKGEQGMRNFAGRQMRVWNLRRLSFTGRVEVDAPRPVHASHPNRTGSSRLDSQCCFYGGV